MRMVLRFILLSVVLAVVGCAPKIPKTALQLSPESLANRQLQTRQFQTGNEAAVLVAANAVLQDLGFNLDETSVELGVVVGSKHRDATDNGQIFMLAVMGGLLQNPSMANSADATQWVRASVVVRALDTEERSKSDLSPEQISGIRQKVFNDVYSGLVGNYSQDASKRIAQFLADGTADSLTNNMHLLLGVNDIPGVTAVRVTFQREVFNQLGQLSYQQQINDVDIYKEFFAKLSKSIFLEANQI